MCVCVAAAIMHPSQRILNKSAPSQDESSVTGSLTGWAVFMIANKRFLHVSMIKDKDIIFI
jgi:hypothetical protein